MSQAVRPSLPTAGVPSSRLGHSMRVSWWTKWGLGKFFTGFLPFSPTTNFSHHFCTLISYNSFHFIRPCDGASGVVGRHPCYSRTYNMASSHLIPRPDLVLDTSWGYLFIVLSFTTLLTSQAISVAFYGEREKSDQFCSEALISTRCSFMCHKSTTWDPWLYFPSEGSHTQDFYALKKSTDPGRVWTRVEYSGKYDNHGTTGVDN